MAEIFGETREFQHPITCVFREVYFKGEAFNKKSLSRTDLQGNMVLSIGEEIPYRSKRRARCDYNRVVQFSPLREVRQLSKFRDDMR